MLLCKHALNGFVKLEKFEKCFRKLFKSSEKASRRIGFDAIDTWFIKINLQACVKIIDVKIRKSEHKSSSGVFELWNNCNIWQTIDWILIDLLHISHRRWLSNDNFDELNCSWINDLECLRGVLASSSLASKIHKCILINVNKLRNVVHSEFKTC